MNASTGLGEPPVELDGFPEARKIDELHRLADWPGVWWYSSIDSLDGPGGRFDLVAPLGTCHLAESFDGAVVEKLLRRPIKMVPAERLGELFHATVTVTTNPPTADLTAAAVTGYGLNAEIHAGLDHRLPRRWAAALHRHGFRGLRHLLRGDATGRAAGRALFGGAGLHARAPAGMTTRVTGVDRLEAERLLAVRGVKVLPVPTSVPLTDPSTVRQP